MPFAEGEFVGHFDDAAVLPRVHCIAQILVTRPRGNGLQWVEQDVLADLLGDARKIDAAGREDGRRILIQPEGEVDNVPNSV